MLRVAVLAVALLALLPGAARAHDADRVFIYVAKTGPGTGRVWSDPPGIDCGSGCLAVFPGNWETNYQPVTLHALADPGSTFLGWSAPCSGAGDCVLELNDAKAVTAQFDGPPRPRFTVTVRSEGPGTVASNPAGISCGATCSATFEGGQNIGLVALPDEKARFVGWSGDCTGTVNGCAFAVDGAKTIGARFELIPDTAAPVVTALASTGRRGSVARLRFRVADDSGVSRRVATVYRGSKRLGEVTSGLEQEDASALYYFLAWRVPKSLAPGALRFCVRAFDAAGNAGGPSCAPLRVS